MIDYSNSLIPHFHAGIFYPYNKDIMLEIYPYNKDKFVKNTSFMILYASLNGIPFFTSL